MNLQGKNNRGLKVLSYQRLFTNVEDFHVRDTWSLSFPSASLQLTFW